MKRALLTDYFREIKNSFNRFLAILMIISIGVAFFVGIRATGPDMKDSADAYFDEKQLMDIKVMSNYGISKEDIAALNAIDDVDSAVGSYATDMLDIEEDRGYNIKVISVPADISEENTGYINRLYLVEGRMPEKSGEIVIDNMGLDIHQIGIGDTMTFDTGRTDLTVDDYLKTDAFTVVGIASTPLFISTERGSSTVGEGMSHIFAAILEEDFTLSSYTEAYVRLHSARGMSAFSEEYKQLIDRSVVSLEENLADRKSLKLEELKEELSEELAESIDDGTENQEGLDEDVDLDQLRKELDDAERELAKQQEEFDKNFSQAQLDIDDAGQQLREAESAYNTGLQEWNTQWAQFESSQSELNQSIIKANSAQREIENQYATVNTLFEISNNPAAFTQEELSSVTSSVQAVNTEMALLFTGFLQGTVSQLDFQAGIYTYQAALDTQSSELWTQMDELERLQTQLNASETELHNAKSELDSQKQNIDNLRQYTQNGQPAYEEQRQLALEQLTQAETDLEDLKTQLNSAEGTVADLDDVDFYIYGREINPGYASYEENADRIAAVAQIFPVFFIFVAALVCLATMTRMVEEQRTQVGILKAIGYKPMQIAGKFLLYSSLAGIIGTVGAILIGFQLYPTILMNVYALMYDIPYRVLPIRAGPSAISAVVALLCTIVTAFFSCRTELIEQAAVLMRPKIPKGGKRILLEKIGLIWNHLSYKWKVAARNIFRYKLRMVMTIIGVAGCTALMVTGWGLKDSITGIVSLQFDEINVYDMTAAINLQADEDDLASFHELLDTHPGIKLSGTSMQEYVDVVGDEKSMSVNMVVPKVVDRFSEFIHLRNMDTKEPIQLDDTGVVITQKLSKLMNIQPGEEIIIRSSDNIERSVLVKDIAENYTLHFIYMTTSMYESVFLREPEYNTASILLQDVPSDEKAALEGEIGAALTERDCILSTTFNSQVVKQFEETMESFNVVVYVMIISAALLAFVVLYNLTIINISERIRELASIKVMGFHDDEVTAYLFRENFFLTMVGIALGIGIGILLHGVVVDTAEIDAALFLRDIRLNSFLLASEFTLVYSLIVNTAMHFKLKKLDMVESLKGVE